MVRKASPIVVASSNVIVNVFAMNVNRIGKIVKVMAYNANQTNAAHIEIGYLDITTTPAIFRRLYPKIKVPADSTVVLGEKDLPSIQVPIKGGVIQARSDINYVELSVEVEEE